MAGHLFILGLFALTGCHQRLSEGERRDVIWTPVVDSAGGEQLRFIESYGLQIETGETASDKLLTLPAMRRLVLETDPAVDIARGELAAATALAGGSGRWADPELSGRILTNEDGQTEMEGALLFAVPIGGHKRAEGQVASIEAELARIKYDEACKRAVRALDNELSRLSWAERRLAVHIDLAGRSAYLADLTRQRRAAAVADPLDVALILADAAHDQRAVVQSQREVDNIQRRLRLMLGLAPGKGDFARTNLEQPGENLDLATAETAYAHRDSWLAAEATYRSAEWNAARYSRARIPDLVLGPAFSGKRSEVNYGFSLGFTLPIFSGERSNYQAALARRDAAFTALQAEKRLANVELTNQLAMIQSILHELAELEGEPLAAAEAAVALAGERYEAGQIDILLLLSTHRSYSSLILEILDLYLARWQALLDLEQTVGHSLRGQEALQR